MLEKSAIRFTCRMQQKQFKLKQIKKQKCSSNELELISKPYLSQEK